MPQALRPSIEMEQKPPQPNEDTFLVVAAFHLLPIVCYSLTFEEGLFYELRLNGVLGSWHSPGPNVFARLSDRGMRKGRKDTYSTKGGTTMTEASRQPKDKNYNLITVLYQSSDNVESLKSYIQDAQAEGDQELVEFFNAVLENNLEAAQRAKEMLVPRFQSEQE